MLAPLTLLESGRRRVLIHRRGLAAVCVALAAWSALDALSAPAPAGVQVLTAAHDLDSGTRLEADDLKRTRFSPGSVPPTGVRDPAKVLGRTLLAPLSQGEPVTAGRLLGSGALSGYPGRSAIGLRVPDQDAAALLDPGDRVALVASDPQGDDDPEVLVRDAVVLAVPTPEPGHAANGGVNSGRLVLFAVPSDGVERVAAVATSHYLSIIWNR